MEPEKAIKIEPALLTSLSLRITRATHAKLKQIAKGQHRPLQATAIDALEQYVEAHKNDTPWWEKG